MARTRSTKAAPAKSSASQKTEDDETLNPAPKIKLEPLAGEPPKVFILPSQATPEARIVTLPHPRHSQPTRYLVCPTTGIYEFTQISAPRSTPRSWLLEAAEGSGGSTEVTTGSDLFVATSFDPLFLILPALSETRTSRDFEDRKRLFLESFDILHKLPQEASHMSDIMQWASLRSLLEARIGAACDAVEAGDETMFRLNHKKLLDILLEKAKRMSRSGLPASLEERFVRRALEAPLILQKMEVSGMRIGDGDCDANASITRTDSGVSQSTLSRTDTDASSISQATTAATSIPDETPGETLVSAIEASPEVTQLQRLQVSFDYICSTYINADLAIRLKQSLRNGDAADSVDFSALDEYLVRLGKLRSETMAKTTTADFSRRRRRDEEEEDERQEKKRKMEEAKKKKASESRALRDLKKVDTSGMKKLSAFFTKKSG